MLTIHVVPNAHIDPVWLWDWREGLNEGIATCQAVVDLMEANHEVTFTRNEAFIYEHIEKHAPRLFERIRRLVDQGRWEIAGGTLLQPDTNMASGESYVRQYLYGQHYFANRFGVYPQIAYQVDSFGHSAGLPSIYRAAGCRFAIQCRPSQKEYPTPSRVFRWRGPDGAEVLTANLESYSLEYCDPDFDVSARINRAALQAVDGLDHWVVLVGLGDHGGGLNRKLLAEIREHIAGPPDECRIKFSTLSDFFGAIEERWDEFPVVKGELQFFARGCYTSVAPVKKAVREAENLANMAERLSTAAGILDRGHYPAQRIRSVWRDTLFNHFHDILPGTSIERCCLDALDHLGKARHDAREISNDTILAILLDIDTSQREGVPVMLFNTHGTPYRGPVELEWMVEYRPLSIDAANRMIKSVNAVALDGTATATQFLPTECDTGIEWRTRSCFVADVPACGYTVYWLQPTQSPADPPSDVVAEETPDEILVRNKHVTVRYRKGEAGIRVTDNVSGCAWFNDCAGRGVVLEDQGDSWGVGVDRWDKVLGFYEPVSARLLQKGPIKASFVVTTEYKGSQLSQEYVLYSQDPQIHCSTRLLWNQPRSMLKLEFPVNAANARGLFSAPYAVVERPSDMGDVPSIGWAAVIGDGANVGVANDCTYGFDIAGSNLRMSIVRSSGYGEMAGVSPDRSANRPFMDMGQHCFRYILTHAGRVSRSFAELNMPLHITLGFPHSGSLPATQSVIAISPESVELVAVKQAEDESGWILRLLETEGKKQTATIRILDKPIAQIAVEPWELGTLRLTRDGSSWLLRKDSLTELDIRPNRLVLESPCAVDQR